MKTQIRDPELARLLAGARFDIAILRLSALELKYRADQARQPAGAPDGQGGEFADEGRGHARGGVAQAGDGLTHRLRGMLPTQPYRLNEPDIVVPSATATQLEAMGNDFYRETGRTMVVTSGSVTPNLRLTPCM